MATQLRMIQVGFCLLRSLPQHQLHMQCVWQISHACNMSDTTLVCTLHPTPTLTCHCQQQLDESCIGCESFALGCCSITVVSRCAQQIESDTPVTPVTHGHPRLHPQWYHALCRAEKALTMVSCNMQGRGSTHNGITYNYTRHNCDSPTAMQCKLGNCDLRIFCCHGDGFL